MKKIAIIVWLFPLSIVCGTVLPCPPCTGVHGMYICTDSTTCVRLIKDELEPARKIRLFTCAVTVRVHGWGDERLPLITDRHGKICHQPQVSTTTTGTRTTPTETRTTPTGTRTTPTGTRTTPTETRTTPTWTRTTPTWTRTTPTGTRTTPTETRTTPTGTRTTPTGTRTTPTGTRTTPTTGTHTIFSRTKNRSSNLSFKESHVSEDDEIFDVPSATGFLAWAITCTLAIILIILKKYLVKTFHPCNQCNVESQPLPDTQPTSADTQATAADTQTTSADTQATSADTQSTSATSADTQPTSADTQPSVAIPTINTPSHSIATSSSSFYDTPLQSATLSTPSSTTVLVSPPAKNTRSKAKGKVLFKL